jgi:hypothetical protein
MEPITGYTGCIGSPEDPTSSTESELSVSKLCRSEDDFALWAAQVRLDPAVRNSSLPAQLQDQRASLKLPEWEQGYIHPYMYVPVSQDVTEHKCFTHRFVH